ncbi:hypothetical protein ABT173_10675, partial [Streptomyces sp. NPDC001795]|uniref:hypothetical protein n=1 Tax=Streptomyces sp. NPDC001795 TaxID=3154525 RepID=UPI003322FEFE
WSIDPAKQTGDCSPTTHSDQHAVAIGSYKGRTWAYVGNDGGIYRRPLNGAVDSGGHAKDWQSLSDGPGPSTASAVLHHHDHSLASPDVTATSSVAVRFPPRPGRDCSAKVRNIPGSGCVAGGGPQRMPESKGMTTVVNRPLVTVTDTGWAIGVTAPVRLTGRMV